jgi:hypothetical protein
MIRGHASSTPVPAAAGIGLRLPHQRWVLEHAPVASWLEVHAENYMTAGQARDELESIARDHHLSLHCVGLSLGAADGPDRDHLARVAELVERFQPALLSDHLSWSSFQGVHFPDLLPLPYNAEALDKVSENVDRVQATLKRSILVENPSRYCELRLSTCSEAEFLANLVQRTGCQVLLDINNIYVTAKNTGQDPDTCLWSYLRALPPHCVGEIHLAGHRVDALEGGASLCIDDHGSAVGAEVWGLFATAIQFLGPRPTLVEWDNNLPDFETLLDEAESANVVLGHLPEQCEHPCCP